MEPTPKRSKMSDDAGTEDSDLDDDEINWALSQLDVLAEVDQKISEHPQGTGPNRTIVREYAECLPRPSHLPKVNQATAGTMIQPANPSVVKALQAKIAQHQKSLQEKERELTRQKGELTILRYRLKDAEKDSMEIRRNLVSQQEASKTQLVTLKTEKERELKSLRDQTKFLENDLSQVRHELNRTIASQSMNASQLLSQSLNVENKSPSPSKRTRQSERQSNQTRSSNVRSADSFYAPVPVPMRGQTTKNTGAAVPNKPSSKAGPPRVTAEVEVQTISTVRVRVSQAIESDELDGERVSLLPFIPQPHIFLLGMERLRKSQSSDLYRTNLKALPDELTLGSVLSKRKISVAPK